jgi:NAD-dependent dihydropyrimidine dehydrogenase PreA subunit
MGYLHQTAGAGKPAGVDALCPFGGLETAYALVTSGLLLKRVAISSVVLLVAVIAVAVVFRRSFCGQICPLGFLQEMFGGLGRKVFKQRPVMPAWLDRPARYLKYVVLVAFIGLAWTTADLAIRPYDPWVAYMHLTSAEVFAEFSIGFAVLVAAVVGSFVYDRFFCKYLCPMGATLGLISKFSIFKVRRTTETCIDCKACDTACPVNITVSEVETVDSPECINCNECVTACPVKDTLAMSTRSNKRLSALGTTVAVVAIFAIVVGGATVAGSFDWKTPSLAEEAGVGRGNGAGGEGAGGQSALSGDFDVSLIKGRTTLAEVSEVTGIPASMFQRVLGVPESEQGLAIKDTKGTYGFSPEDVRTMVELYRIDPAAAEAYIPLGSSEE